MKCSESWLREWVNPNLTREKLCETLTMAGLEVEALQPVALAFTGVVVGQIEKVAKHPEADRLHVCEVTLGKNKSLTIVCGAENVKPRMKVAVATLNAELPNKSALTATSIRGIASEGMLCSASELGLSEENLGILELPNDAPLGEEVWTYLKLADYTIDISITPNRGDCLSIKGIAREVSALTGSALHAKAIETIKPTSKDSLSVTITDKAGCPHYVGRVIRNVKADAETPILIKERLRRSGVRSISPIVDVTNYVMLELGQPMHAFDLKTIKGGIYVRTSKAGEHIALLDGSEKELDAETLLIADQEKPLAIAGVMGGLDSSVTLLTQDIFLESAYFSPKVIAKQRQYYNLSSDSAYRFERGVDYTIQREAIERATQLILSIAGGEAGPVTDIINKNELPKTITISFPHEKIVQLLGVEIEEAQVKAIFKALAFPFTYKKNLWTVTVPSYRSDLVLPEDLIEEIARLYGYDNIPTHPIRAVLGHQAEDNSQDLQVLRQALCDQGYQEIISYSFIDKKLKSLLDPEPVACELVNPITAEMTLMRTNLWPGLMGALLYNQSRQQHRVRLFEIGACFIKQGQEIVQQMKLGGLITGAAYQEQWGIPQREADFYDLKGNIENILKLSALHNELVFKPGTHPALHPGQTATIYYQNQKVGILGALHPLVLQALDLDHPIFLFELEVSLFVKTGLPRFREISKFPEIRRDLAILVNQTIPADKIQATIKVAAGDWLKDVFIFDVYQGKGIAAGLKSIALALILQHPTRTLVDAEVTELMERVIVALQGDLGAELRS